MARASEPQGLGVVTQPERAEARAAEGVACPAGVTDGREQLVRLRVQSQRLVEAFLGIGEEPELARGVREQERVAQFR